jgi:tetratricopeptide (TPR) repeat protein
MIGRTSFAALFILVNLPSYSQFLPDLQAKSTAEYDAYLDVLDAPTPEKGVAFEKAFPHSTLRLPVCELEVKAFRSAGKLEDAIAAAGRGLDLAPDYPPLLVERAELLANAARNLDEAARSARRALELLQTAKAPLRVSPQDWTDAISGLRAKAHAALGLVQFKRNDPATAITEFESAIASRNPADPAIHYRLGRLFALTGKTADAKRHLEIAAQSTDKTLRALAHTALQSLK